jgi:uncharacterized protein (DUF2235 family)
MRRLVFCFDGSWSRLDAVRPTNVVLTAESVVPIVGATSQLIFYDEGVGTEEGQKWSGGFFGNGLLKNLADGYRFLIFNYAPGDEIFVFGFSRGAFTARSFAGLLSNCGIIRRRDAARATEAIELYRGRDDTRGYLEKLMRFRSESSPDVCVSDEEDAWRSTNVPDFKVGTLPRLSVKYLGVWDTVGALGIPGYLVGASEINKKYLFHNVSLSPFVQHARHAVAIDEHRRDFFPTLWDNLEKLNRDRNADPDAEDAPYQQKWFPGVHGAVGGGGKSRGLSDQSLDWIWDGARNAGLVLDTSRSSRIFELLPDHRAALSDESEEARFNLSSLNIEKLMGLMALKGDRTGPDVLRDVHTSARRRWHEDAAGLMPKQAYRPKPLEKVAAELDKLDKRMLGVGADDATPLDPNKFKIHTVEQGDTLTAIAQKYLGKAALADRIFEANRFKISDPDRIYVGQVLRIPIG